MKKFMSVFLCLFLSIGFVAIAADEVFPDDTSDEAVWEQCNWEAYNDLAEGVDYEQAQQLFDECMETAG
ncbi:MAG: hypothetical protein QNK37_12005 [Acidobacteriota bacterium]|nr:hypothetical protein [Acidobacteriota bacterium]